MTITPKWKNHPLTLAGNVELVPTAWLSQYRGIDVTPATDLKDGSPANMDQLWENIKSDGLYDPVIIRVGKANKKFRLESGNHRIQVLMKHAVAFTPATVEVQELCGPQVENVMTDATHNFDFTADVVTEVLESGYLKPTTVFKSLIGTIELY
ncbi:MAG: ParB N-terminal domain-containing protein [Patescibacteria group bacterium]